jgi:inositol phosphorylceramide mannosyltransferase catalytic subunit
VSSVPVVTERSIPRVFHRIWFGGPEPEHHLRWAESWRHLHPGWRVVTWTEHTVGALHNQAIFDAATSPAQMADVARYELLLRYGGVYLDTDFEALRPIDALLDGVSFFCASEDEIWLSLGIIGSTPGHPVLRALVDELAAHVTAHPDAPVNEQTGPYYMTRVINRLRSGPHPEDVTVFPSALFYPYHFSEPWRAGDSFPEAYAVHHWDHSWARSADAA